MIFHLNPMRIREFYPNHMGRRRVLCSEAGIICHRKFEGEQSERVSFRGAGGRGRNLAEKRRRNPRGHILVPRVDVIRPPMRAHDAPSLQVIERRIEMRVVTGLAIEVPETEVVPQLMSPDLPFVLAQPHHEAAI